MLSRIRRLENKNNVVNNDLVVKMAEYLEKKYLHDVKRSTDAEILDTFPQLARFIKWSQG